MTRRRQISLVDEVYDDKNAFVDTPTPLQLSREPSLSNSRARQTFPQLIPYKTSSSHNHPPSHLVHARLSFPRERSQRIVYSQLTRHTGQYLHLRPGPGPGLGLG